MLAVSPERDKPVSGSTPSRAPITALLPELSWALDVLGARLAEAQRTEDRRELYRLRDLVQWLYSSRQLAVAMANVLGGAELREAVCAALREGDRAAVARFDLDYAAAGLEVPA